MTDPNDKQRTRDRYRRQQRHWRSREEEQQIASARRSRPDRLRDRADDDDEQFEKITRRERVLGHVSGSGRAGVVPNSAETHGTVTWLSRGRATVRCHDGERTATLAPSIAAEQQTAIAIGDEVKLHEHADGAVIVAVGDRRSELVRVDPGNQQRRRVLAANVDWVVLVLTAQQPRVGLIDRLRLALADSGAQLAICINKCDLPHDADDLSRQLGPYVDAGLTIVVVSATRGDQLDELRALVSGQTAAFVGHSGVGKSTLLNCIDPDSQRATKAVRERDGKGRHTTTASSLRALTDGTRLIDTPGVRAFGLPEGHSDAIAAFEDVQAFADGCRFRDCAHTVEPGCAVRAAVEANQLPSDRYQAYLRLREDA